MKRMPNAFTLVELLVVVAIIGILAAIGSFGYTVAVKLSRDAKRQADLKVIQSALEQYHNDQHHYPPTAASVTPGTRFTDPAGTKVYLNNIPTDPTAQGAATNYHYHPFLAGGGSDCTLPATCQFYCLYAILEAGTSLSDSCVNNGLYNFEVTPP